MIFEILKKRRKKLRLTQKKLAERVGLSAQHISRIERGELDIKLSTLMALCRELGLEIYFKVLK